ncbi:MAG: hypothetical protein K0S15_1047 [Solirubrobacterales bacterium]|nr:hypothetical protein [Solirubrobacterales bacterium]
MDRERARANIGSGLLYATLALFVFGFAFYVTILYLG